jgi:hypothetical protein
MDDSSRSSIGKETLPAVVEFLGERRERTRTAFRES